MLDIADAIDVARVREHLNCEIIWEKFTPLKSNDKQNEKNHQRTFDQLVYANTRMMLDQSNHSCHQGILKVSYLQRAPCILCFASSKPPKKYYSALETQQLLDTLSTQLNSFCQQTKPSPGWIQCIFKSLYAFAHWARNGLTRMFSAFYATSRKRHDRREAVPTPSTPIHFHPLGSNHINLLLLSQIKIRRTAVVAECVSVMAAKYTVLTAIMQRVKSAAF